MKKSPLPRSSREAFAMLDKMLSAEDIQILLAAKYTSDQHFGLGMWIRNHWIYSHQEEIMKAFGLYKEEDGFPNTFLFLPDHLSDIIVKRYIKHLKRKFVK
jgi:hypothetical protein